MVLKVGQVLEVDREFKVFFEDKNMETLSSFIESTKDTLSILTYTIHSQAADMLLSKLRPGVSAKIIVKTIGPKIYRKIMDKAKKRGVDVYLARCRDLHAKVYIRDDGFVHLGSSNLTVDSLGNHETSADIEADVITNDQDIVKSSRILFDALLEEKALSLKHHDRDEGFISSGYGIPTKIIELIENAERRIVIVTPSNVQDEIIYLIRRLNERVKLKFIVSWPDEAQKRDISGLEALRYLAERSPLTEMIPVSRRIHAKILIFDGEIALISSVNLTRASLMSNIEAGILTKDRGVIDQLEQRINSFHPVAPTKILEREERKERRASEDELSFPIDEKRVAFKLERIGVMLKLLKLRIGFQAFRREVIRGMKK